MKKYGHLDEESALKELQNFIKNRIVNYSEGRNFPNIIGTSKLSPLLNLDKYMLKQFGMNVQSKKKTIGTSKFLAEIGWREFNHTLINHFPHMLKNNYSKKFDKFPWEKNSKFLYAWKKGLTGYPIVDAG